MQDRAVAISGRLAVSIIIVFVVLKLIIHLPFNGSYGYHADELLYLAMAEQLAWGYKEGPPLISFLTWIAVQLGGDSLWVLRLLPTLCGALLVCVTGMMTRMLGGGSSAVLVACTAILLDPSFLATGYMMQPVVFDQLGWALLCFFLLRFFQTGNSANLFFLGITVGLGMMNKFSIALYLGSLLIALPVRPGRKLTFKELLYIAIPGLLTVFPHFIWQMNHGFPFADQLGELETYYWSKTGYPTLIKQLLFSHGAAGIVIATGISYLLFSVRMRPYQFVGIGFLLLQFAFLYLQAKTYYTFGALPILYAAGAVFIARLLAAWKRPGVNAAFFATIIISGVVAIPAVVPVLPLRYTVAWLDLMKQYTGVTGPLRWDDGTTHRIPQYFAQMLGWQELATETLIVYRSLPEAKRASTVIITDNYQQAGAISFYGKDEAPATVSLRPSFFSKTDAGRTPEYTILVTSNPRPQDVLPGLMSSQRIDFPDAEVNGSVIYLIRRAGPIAYQAP